MIEGDSQDPGAQFAAAITAGDPEHIAQTASRNIWRLFANHYQQLVAAVTALPAETRHRFPALYLVHPSAPVVMRSTRAMDVSAFEGCGGIDQRGQHGNVYT